MDWCRISRDRSRVTPRIWAWKIRRMESSKMKRENPIGFGNTEAFDDVDKSNLNREMR